MFPDIRTQFEALVPAQEEDALDDVQQIDGAINYFVQRAILTPTNKAVTFINSEIVKKLVAEHLLTSYEAIDTITNDAEQQHYNLEFIRKLNIGGLPSYDLHLAPGMVIMLLRNLDPANGDCNGTRYIILKLTNRVIQARSITGSNIGSIILISRLRITPTDIHLPLHHQPLPIPCARCICDDHQ